MLTDAYLMLIFYFLLHRWCLSAAAAAYAAYQSIFISVADGSSCQMNTKTASLTMERGCFRIL